MAVTIRDIARELGLSAMTVSRVLSQVDNSLVKPDTRKRVEEAALRLGYRPNQSARALASQGVGLELSISEMDWHFDVSKEHRRFHWPVDGILAVDPPPHDILADLLQPTLWENVPRVHLGSGPASVFWG